MVKRLALGGLFLAIAVILPTVFHMTGIPGPVFLPMHIPVLLAGIYLGPALGALIGVVAPALNFLLTGMPPISPPILPLMIGELAAYGLVSGWLSRVLLRHRRAPGPGRGAWRLLWRPLLGAMVAGRVVLGLEVAILNLLFGVPMLPWPYVAGSVITGLPGVAAQLLLIPALVRALPRPQGQGQG